MALTPPDVPGYQCIQLLGQGAMGTVWRARQHGLGREVALKLLKPGVAGADARARLLREAAVLAQARHPHLVELLDAGEGPDGAPWLTMELVEGRSLEQVLAEDGPLEVGPARRVMFEVAEALEALHQLGLIHRDVKPGNIMVGPRDRAVLMDLGIARGVAHRDVTASGLVLGTLAYLSPEVLQGHPPEASDDWYAWAITWWHLLTGRVPIPPQEALSLAIVGTFPAIPDPVPAMGALPEADRDALRALTRRRGERPTDLAALVQLGRAASTPAPTRSLFPGSRARGQGTPTRSTRAPGPSHRGALAGGASLLLGALLAAALLRPELTPAPSPSPLRPATRQLTVTSTWRGPSDLLVRLAGATGARPRAERIRAAHREPAAIFRGADDEAWVWLAGLAPDESGALHLWSPGPPSTSGRRAGARTTPSDRGRRDTPHARREERRVLDVLERRATPRAGMDRRPNPGVVLAPALTITFAPAPQLVPPPPEELPPALRSIFPEASEDRAVSEAYLDELEAAFRWDQGRLGEPELVLGMPIGSRFPESAWPAALGQLAAGGARADNLLRALRAWEVDAPDAVARQVQHLLPALETRVWLVGAWAARARMAQLARLDRRAPADLVPRLEEWLVRWPKAARGVHALAMALARAGKGRGDGPLGRTLAAARAGTLPRPADIAALPASERPFAIALQGFQQEGRRHIPWLFQLLRDGDPSEALAADAALEALQYGRGAVWNCGDQGTLWFWGVDDRKVLDLRLQPTGLAVHRRDLERIWVWLPGRRGEVRWRYPETDRAMREEIQCH